MRDTNLFIDVPCNNPSHTRRGAPGFGAADGTEAVAGAVGGEDICSRTAARNESKRRLGLLILHIAP
jgi:hypothetical protein